ncbi:hypothetical protein MNB_SM-6-1514 [hydrothermal vent metagenome]|uniref:Uncharacterized protein n=1 Tax=hydrothermal vent metagenome TaxID=652676 RepID=A0A1W1BNK1_9ZZZZ
MEEISFLPPFLTSVTISSKGKKSIAISPFLQYREADKTAGPLMPLCAKSISSRNTLFCTFISTMQESPLSSFIQNCSFCSVRPTSAGVNFFTSMPKLCAISKPTSLAPNVLKLSPPVATTTFFAYLTLLSVFTAKSSPSFVTATIFSRKIISAFFALRKSRLMIVSALSLQK